MIIVVEAFPLFLAYSAIPRVCHNIESIVGLSSNYVVRAFAYIAERDHFLLFLSSLQAPVLAKRKTKAMKEMEQASVKRAETRGRSAVRRANFTQQFVIPDHTTTDYERQLKKIATRGGGLELNSHLSLSVLNPNWNGGEHVSDCIDHEGAW